MKKDRNCGMAPYPIYPPYQGMNPGMMPMPIGTAPMMQSQMTPVNNDYGVSSNTIEQQLNTLQDEVNTLQRRVNNLENLYNQLNTSSTYNSSNYQMM